MELRLNEYKLPEAVSFNYEELKTGLTEKVHIYETMVYGDDQIKAAKADRADLNKLKNALNDERKRLEKEYMIPFNTFKQQINELIAIIDKPISIIDARIKENEEAKKAEKRKQIEELFAGMDFPEHITLRKIWDDSWLNTTASLGAIKCRLEDAKYRDEQNIKSLQSLPEFSFEAIEYYKRSNMDMAGALTEASKHAEIAKAAKLEEERKAREAAEEEAERARMAALNAQKADAGAVEAQVEEVPTAEVEAPVWVKFEALITTSDALALKDFFDTHGIAFRPIA